MSSIGKVVALCAAHKLPVEPKSYYRRAVAYLHLKDSERGLQDIQNIMQEQPDHKEALAL